MERKLLDIPLPDAVVHYIDIGLWLFEEFLSLFTVDYDTIEIWVMKEYKVHSSWTKTLVFPIHDTPYFSPIYSDKKWHFTASRKQPKTEAVLDAIFQADNESLRSFIERFNKEAVQVETTDDMKKYLLQRGLRPNSDFARAVGIEKPRTFSDLLLKSQAYIQYEEQQAADAARYGRAGNNQPAPRSNAEQSSRGGGRRRGERPREPRGPPSTFSNYTPLSKTQEEIWKECNSAEFTRAGIKFPRQQPTKPGQDKSKYCKYHKGYGHLTDDCIQLKDAIEILIRNGQIKQYVKRGNAPRA
ncbi:unnamed protein product [Trifolium pratense]|uniref:Uncharacterized protein n=1 Tax=Trifolium pratense TaxID=57577 RepID=A0ACB0KE80_TRIPR|nr:unnamed protein product [Trifolium pratense]